MVRIINIDTKTRTIRVSNGKDDLEWFTTDTGSHVPLKKGQSKAEAIKEHFGDKKAKQQPAKLDKGIEEKRLRSLWEKKEKAGLEVEYAKQFGGDVAKAKEKYFKAEAEWVKAREKAKQQSAKQEPYSDPFHKEAEQKRNAAKDAWLKAKPQVDTKKLRAGDPETFEKYMDWRWQATTLSDGYDEMMKDFGGRDEFNKAAQAYEKLKQQPEKQKSKPTSYQLEDAFEEADLGEEWKSAQRRMDFHGVSQYTIKDIIDSGMYEAGDIIEALESKRHDKIDEMRKMADKTVGEKRREAQWEKQFGPLDEKKYQEWKKKSEK